MTTLSINTLEVIENMGFTLEHAMKTFENGNTLFKGLYEISYKGINIGSIRESESVFTFLDKQLYRPIGTVQKNDISLDQVLYILENIRYYHFNSNLSEMELNKHQEAIINSMIKRVKRGADINHLNAQKDRVLNVWKNNAYMSHFIKQIDTESIYKSIQLPKIINQLDKILVVNDI